MSNTVNTELRQAQAPSMARWGAALALCIGSIVTLCVYGYQYGRGNHSSYLIEPLRLVDPSLFKNDWFANHTLQYHVVFSHTAALLMRLGIVQPAFAAGYVLLIVLFHIAWRGIIRHLGGGDGGYLLSVALYYLSAAGTALGMFQFFQDSALLSSNIANVALLWGLWLWMLGRLGWSGMAFGIAGIFAFRLRRKKS